MAHPLRSAATTEGRRMAGARSLWRANGMREEQIGRPIIAVVNSFTQFVPGHVHLHEIGQQVKAMIEAQGCFAAEFNTIAIDDGIAMGHDGMLYSLPSRELIADSVEYMVQRPQGRRHGLHLQLRQDHPGHAHGGHAPQHPGDLRLRRADGGRRVRATRRYDLVDAMVMAADDSPSATRSSAASSAPPARPAARCSGMFTANSMNCLNEALGLALPGNGTVVATHANRLQLFEQAAARIVEMADAYYGRGRRLGPAALDRHQGGLPERHGARHRHGRLDQHRAPPPGHRPRGRGRLHHGGHRRAFAQGALPVQGRAQLRTTTSRT